MALILLIRALNVKSFNLAYVLFYCMVLCYAYANSTLCILSACSKPRVHSVNAQLLCHSYHILLH